jgi:Flp pilus assembly protein TadD
MLRRLCASVLFVSLCSLPALAQDDRELNADARRQYNAGLREASALVGERQFDSAQAKLDALLRERPREPQARFLLGVVETERGRIDAAMAVFRGLIEDYPELPEPYNNIAVLYARRGEYESARIALETAVRTAPEWPVAHENLGDIYARLAAGEYDRAAKLDRDSKTAPAKLMLIRQLLAPPSATPKS